MVLSAMVATITMPVAAESPPMNTKSARPFRSAASGRVSTKVSASTLPSGNCISPASAIGSTKMLITSR